jgi:hypothetical protein
MSVNTVIASIQTNSVPSGTVSINGIAKQGQTLFVSNNLADADGLGVISYQWRADGLNISGANNSSLILTQVHVGKVITVTASYTDGARNFETITSGATSAVSNVNDSPTGTISIYGSVAQKYTDVSVANSLADQDGLGQFSYAWKIDSTLVGNQSTLQIFPDQSDVGKTLTVTVSYVDGFGNQESITSAGRIIANTNDKPHGSVNISGGFGTPFTSTWTIYQGQILTASNDLTDNDGIGTISYQWKANGVNIVGATNATLTLIQLQVGKIISVTANYIDSFGATEPVESSSTSNSIKNINDAPTGIVTINGNTVQDQILMVTNTLADVDGLGTVNYQWKADGTNIEGATNASLTLTQAQVGKSITVIASYLDLFGAVESVQSTPTSIVIALSNADTTPPTIAVSTSASGLTSGGSATITFALSEASSNFTSSDVTVSGGTLSNFSGSGTSYTATFTPAANSTTNGVVSVSNGVFTDAAGNANADGSDANNSVTMSVNTTSTSPLIGNTFVATKGADAFLGTTAIDTVVVSGAASNYSITKTANGYKITDKAGSDATDTVSNVERVKFTDSHLALDIDGNAGTTAKILGAVFGKDSVGNKAFVGIGLSFLDAGWTYDRLGGLALDAAGAQTNDQIVTLLWTNVIGSKPSTADKAPFIALLENGMTPGELVHLAADTIFNTTNINLIGLSQTGIEFNPV